MPTVFRILGPIAVELNERVVSLGRRERALLGVLLLNAGEVVSVERLIDGVWGESPPSSAKHMVHEYVSRLRIACGGASRIVTRAPGYLAVCREGDLDAQLFSQLAAAARAATNGDAHAQALRYYERALGLWRGDALEGVELEGAAQIDVARLDQERLLVAEERFDCALALGQHRELVPELERHLDAAPLRERPRAQLMLALYRAGRQTDALDRYREGRALLVEHAGVEPGPALRQLERAILCQDPSLEIATPIARRDVPPHQADLPVAAPSPRRAIALAGAAIVALTVAVAWLATSRGGSPHVPPARGNAVAVIDAGSARLVKSIGLSATPARSVTGRGAKSSPSAVAAGVGSIWVANVDSHSVSRIDPLEQVVTQTIQVGNGPAGIAFGAGFVWVTNSQDATISKIDPETNTEVQKIMVGNAPTGIAAGKRDVWVANSSDGSVTRIDSTTGKTRSVTPVNAGADGIAVGAGSVWVTSQSTGTVTRIDSRSAKAIGPIPAGTGAGAVMAEAGSVWVANSLDGTVTRIDPVSNSVRDTISVGDGPSGIALTPGAVWVSNELTGSISKIDRARRAVVKTVPTGNRPEGIATEAGALFIALRASGDTHRGGTLRVLTASDAGGFDPAITSETIDHRLLGLTNDGLTSFRKVGGGAGNRLVPDLAVSLPTPTDGGRSYSFQLRPGIRYSTGALVRPGDFRRALERALSLAGNYQRTYFAGIVGAHRCLAAPKKPCDLSRGIVTHRGSSTITFRLTAPDPDLPVKLALPIAFAVPEGTPLRRLERPLPATGPYEIASYHPSRAVRLVRNPKFREWSRAAQPQGFPDEIVVRFEGSADARVAAVVNGSADLALDGERPSPAVLTSLRTQHSSRLEVNPQSSTYFLVLNTRVAPFDDVRVRQALNLAIDRERLRDLTVGRGLGQVTCQVLPPNFDGYRRYCPHTAEPSADGAWTAPDLERARQLVRSSATAGHSVTVWLPKWITFPPSSGRYVVSVLDSLGYKARLRIAADPYRRPDRLHLQAGFYGWIQDFASASDFLVPTLACSADSTTTDSANIFGFCDPAIDRQIAHAQSLRTSDPEAASRTWGAVDRAVVDQAPWVPYANGVVLEVTSDRVGNYQYNPQVGTLLGQLWVR